MRHCVPKIVLAGTLLTLTACGGGGGYSPPSGGGSNTGSTLPPPVGPLSIGLALPTGLIGIETDPTYGAVAGFTQTVFSQTLAFQTGTTITIRNLSSNTQHTLGVLSTTGFTPSAPALAASGGSTIAAGYSSGSINAGASVSATLGAAGVYYIGCAYHYANAPGGMRTALNVTAAANPTPGPTATPPPPSNGGGGYGGY